MEFMIIPVELLPLSFPDSMGSNRHTSLVDCLVVVFLQEKGTLLTAKKLQQSASVISNFSSIDKLATHFVREFSYIRKVSPLRKAMFFK